MAGSFSHGAILGFIGGHGLLMWQSVGDVKMLTKFRSKVAAMFAAIIGVSFAPLAMADGTYDTLTSAVDWADAITAIVAVAALVAAVLVVIRGSRIVLGMIRR